MTLEPFQTGFASKAATPIGGLLSFVGFADFEAKPSGLAN
jgi:hypothetical protein